MNVWNGQNAGNISGHKFKNLNLYYIQIAFYGVKYRAHRIAWLYMTGYWPDVIDHENGDGTDNRWLNIRNIKQVDNTKNQKLSSRNKSGTVGVSWCKLTNKWVVNIKKIYLGRFEKLEDAIAVRKAADIKYGFHENHGKTLEERKFGEFA